MTARTAIEIDRDGTPLRVFHRRGSSAWTHPIDDPTYPDVGRHGAIVSRPCSVCLSDAGKDGGRAPGAAPRRGTAPEGASR
jgi:hypothetical protein